MGDNDNLNIFAESPRGPPWATGDLGAMDAYLSAREFGELASELQLEGLDMGLGGQGPSMPPLGSDMPLPAPPAPMPAAPPPQVPDLAAAMNLGGVGLAGALPQGAAGLGGPAAAAAMGAGGAPASPLDAAAAQQQREAATQISRLYNHMLMQLPLDVQRRAQQHLILRTAAMKASGIPVIQGTMLVQQELLPLMQQAFMHLATGGGAGKLGGGGAGGSGVLAAAGAQPQQAQQQQAAELVRQQQEKQQQQQQQQQQAEAQRSALLRQQLEQQQLEKIQRLQALHLQHKQAQAQQQAQQQAGGPSAAATSNGGAPSGGGGMAGMSFEFHPTGDAQQAKRMRTSVPSSPSPSLPPASATTTAAAGTASGGGAPQNFAHYQQQAHQRHQQQQQQLPSDPLAAAAVARGRAAAAKIQAREAAARYSWNAGMLGELFAPTPVHKAGLLGHEAVVAGDGASLMPPPPPVTMPRTAPGSTAVSAAAANVHNAPSAATSANLLGGLARLSPAQLASAGTEGQRLLVAAMRRLQAMQAEASAAADAGEGSKASPSVSGAAAPSGSAAAANDGAGSAMANGGTHGTASAPASGPSSLLPGGASDGEGGGGVPAPLHRESRIAHDVVIVPIAPQITHVEIPRIAASGAGVAAPAAGATPAAEKQKEEPAPVEPPPEDDDLPPVQL